jgi:hypothetical protein
LSGYLTLSEKTLQDNGMYSCVLCLPNHEIRTAYTHLLESIFNEGLFGNKDFFYEALFSVDIKVLTQLLQKFILTSMGMYDLNKKEPEKSYHLFVLGMLVTLEKTYRVTSNRQSGYGRYDIMLVPYDTSQVGIIIEFKRVDDESEFEQAAQEALAQIKHKNYALELETAGIKKIISYAMIFAGTKVYITCEKNF